MSRSVETVRDSEKIFFACSDFDEWDWGDLISNVTYELLAKYKSLDKSDKWMNYPYRETRVLLENKHVQITVSEYRGCGVFCVFVNPINEDYFPYTTNLAERWLRQNIDGIREVIKKYADTMVHVATFSNGEAIYRRVE